jgi:hypothetical protein
MQAHRIVFRILGRPWLEREVAPAELLRGFRGTHTELTVLDSLTLAKKSAQIER